MGKSKFGAFETFEELEAAYKELTKESYDQRYLALHGKPYPHDISDKVLKGLEPTLKSQDHFGIDKYGKPLKSEYRYNWSKMGDEELADFLKYRVCEKERIELVEKKIRQAFESDDVFTKNALLLEALDLLAIEGTEK